MLFVWPVLFAQTIPLILTLTLNYRVKLQNVESCGLWTRLVQLLVGGWRRSVVVSALASINVVNRHWAGLVFGWVTVCGRVNHLGM